MAGFKMLPFSDQIRTCAERLQAGDLDALGRLFDLTSARLIRYSETLLGNRSDAEDALQTALVRIAESPHLLAASRLPWPYLLRVARNEALSLLRGRRKLVVFESEPSLTTCDEATLERHEAREQVQFALQKLPAEQAEVVVLKIWEEMTLSEIAIVTGESANTVASRYRYALDKLSRTLAALAEEECRG